MTAQRRASWRTLLRRHHFNFFGFRMPVHRTVPPQHFRLGTTTEQTAWRDVSYTISLTDHVADATPPGTSWFCLRALPLPTACGL